jgi:hypothetical protein
MSLIEIKYATVRARWARRRYSAAFAHRLSDMTDLQMQDGGSGIPPTRWRSSRRHLAGGRVRSD